MRLVLHAALALLLPAAASAQANLPSDPLMFVEGVYEQNIAGTRPDDDKLFAPELASLLKQDAETADKEGVVGQVDYDILCTCQDTDGLRAVPTLVSRTDTGAVVSVRLTFSGKYPRVITLKLERISQDWRIADVVTQGETGGSLLAELRDGLSEHPSEPAPVPVDTTPGGCAKPGEEVEPASENCQDIRHVTERWRVIAPTDVMNWPSDQAFKVVGLKPGETIVSSVSVRIGTRTWLQVQKENEYLAWVRREALQPLP